jgi:hypothetical protein
LFYKQSMANSKAFLLLILWKFINNPKYTFKNSIFLESQSISRFAHFLILCFPSFTKWIQLNSKFGCFQSLGINKKWEEMQSLM